MLTNCKILIGNLAVDANEEQIRHFFTGTSGAIGTVDIAKDTKTGRCLGYAFVEMSTEDEAQQAINDLSGMDIVGRRMTLSLVETIARQRKWYEFGSR
ncbi:MAG: RNA-binding protein [Candidatus Obscuribacterales bacterium]|nr:RNA-binding protein [Candidatus Obscuribacterales bacterium]